MSMKIHDERGFTLVELLVASMITMLVLGGAVMLTSRVQNGYRRQVEDSAAEQEGRYALDFIGKLIRASGNNPYAISVTVPGLCPVLAPVAFTGIIFQPAGPSSIRLQSDSNPPDKRLGGDAAGCGQENEDVTVSFDPVADTITFRDNNIGAAAIRTDAVIDNLEFVYRDADRKPVDVTDPSEAVNVVYVETKVTVRTRTIDVATGSPVTRTLSQEVRIRGHHY
jgi:Tfp pilus assembly protein PilW